MEYLVEDFVGAFILDIENEVGSKKIPQNDGNEDDTTDNDTKLESIYM